jgi:CDP-paratose synthetase
VKILITGATGFIGKNLVKLLLSKDFEIYCLVRENSNLSQIYSKVDIIEYSNLTEDLVEIFKEKKFNGVVHLASLFLAEHKINDINSLITSNVLFGTQLLEASKISGVKWFINTGTFWQNYENNDYNPVNLYAATKEAFENIAKYYIESSELIFTTIKLNDTFGPNDTRNKIFNLWDKISKSNETLEMSAGEQIIDISFIDDVISAYDILINHLNSKDANNFKNRIFAVKAEKKVSLKELSKIFEKATDTKLNIIWGKREYRNREVMIPWEKGEIVPSWKPKYTLSEAIRKIIRKS